MAKAPVKPRTRTAATSAGTTRKTKTPAAKQDGAETAPTRRRTRKPVAAPSVEASAPDDVPMTPPTDSPAAAVATPAVVTASAPKIGPAALRKKELIDAVSKRSGHKRKDTKAIVETMLEVLGEALADDRELNLLPFAKVKVQRVKQLQSARVTVAKLRQPKPAAKTAESED